MNAHTCFVPFACQLLHHRPYACRSGRRCALRPVRLGRPAPCTPQPRPHGCRTAMLHLAPSQWMTGGHHVGDEHRLDHRRTPARRFRQPRARGRSASTSRSSRRRWGGSHDHGWHRPCPEPARSGSSRRRRASSTPSRTRSARSRELTDRPFGVNIAQAFVRDPRDRRVRHRSGCEVRDDLRRVPDEVHVGAQGCRLDRVPRRPHARRGVEGGRRRCRRAGRGRR